MNDRVTLYYSMRGIMRKTGRWKRTTDHNGRCRWESDLGTAYSKHAPPETDPLTAEDVQLLPDETPIVVLWGGGNGPHRYIWRDGKVFTPCDERDKGTMLGGLIGSWGLVGPAPFQDKVWRATPAPLDMLREAADAQP